MMEDVRLDGRTVLITGANTGIGKETAMDMARRGAHVVLGCRDQGRGDTAVQDVKTQTGNMNVILGLVDLGSFESIRNFAKHFKETEQRLDILVNNAAVAMTPGWKTKENFEMQFGVNHIGHFLLTMELLDLIKASSPSRIVNVSSEAHKGRELFLDDINMEKSYSGFKAYARSKLANILFTRELHRRLQGTGVTAYSLHPGVVKTEIARNGGCCIKCCWTYCTCCCKSPAEGAMTSVYCSVAPGIETHSGKYFCDSAVKTPDRRAEDDVAALKLWEVTEELIRNASTENTPAEAS